MRPTGTINLNAVNPKGEISSVTTTSGLAWKIPGRVGDSPIVGAGQYCDNEVGAAGSTGRGESNIMVCGGFLTVEHMRRGMAPVDACLETLRRVVAMTPPRLLREDGRPTFGLTFYAVNKKGEFGSASMTPGRYAVHDGKAEAAGKVFVKLTKLIDQTAAKGTLHKNAAARKKSRLAKRLNKLAAAK